MVLIAKRGSNAAGVGRYNERLVLSTIRRMDGASKADVARATGLSPQAAARIVESLEAEGRVIRTGKRTGGMGQPSILYRINGESGCTIGVEIGRDHMTCVMLDFDGRVMARESRATDFPTPTDAAAGIDAFARARLAALPAARREGFIGFGIAMPWFIGEWRDEAAISDAQVRPWSSPDLESLFRNRLDADVTFENDGNAGALAELLCGEGLGLSQFLYIHLGNFVGGGLVLGGEIQRGRHGNAGALASMPVPDGDSHEFLLHRASLYELAANPALAGAQGERWITQCAKALAFTIISANSLLDLEAVIVGGALEDQAIDRLLALLRAQVRAAAPRDFFQPVLARSRNGDMAPAIGAGLLPLHSSYSPNLNALLNIGGDAGD